MPHEMANTDPPRRLRVLQVITELAPAGAERVLYHLATGLAARGHGVQVANLFDRPGRNRDVGDQLIEAGIPLTRLGMRSKRDISVLARLAAVVRQFNPDIIHSHLWHADLVTRLWRLAAHGHRPATVSTVHIAERRPVAWRFAIDRVLHRWSDKITFVSQSVCDFHAPSVGAARSRCVVIPNGIDLNRYQTVTPLPVDAPGPVVIGTIARLDRQKALPDLLRAARTLVDGGLDVRVLIAGDGPERHALADQTRTLNLQDRVTMLGFVEDVPRVLGQLRVFVLPSLWEGFGLATLEAMAAGLPVVVTDVPGSRDLVRHEQTGLIVRPGHPDALANAIRRYLDDPALAGSVARHARQTAMAYSLDAMVSRYERLYVTLTG